MKENTMKRIIIAILFVLFAVQAFAGEGSMTKRIRYMTEPGYTYAETIADTASGNYVIIAPRKNGFHPITLRVIAGANTGTFYTSTSSEASVIAETANWEEWSKGTTTGTDSVVVTGPITAVYGKSVSGQIVIELCY